MKIILFLKIVIINKQQYWIFKKIEYETQQKTQ